MPFPAALARNLVAAGLCAAALVSARPAMADDPLAKLAFGADGVVRARIDCNRAQGGWKSAGPNQLEFGPMAITRAQCPPGSLHDQIVKQLPYVRSYVMKQGHLFLSLMADGGIYEFEPVR